MTIESPDDLEALRRVGRLVAQALRCMRDAARSGLTTGELDFLGAEFLRDHGARSAPQLFYNFPGFSCISVNEEIVHGVPGARRLAPGDVLKIDVTAELDGYIADAALTVVLPPVAPEADALRRCAEEAFAVALKAARVDRPVSAIGRAVDGEVRSQGFSVLRALCGHGVGRHLHEEPSVPNFFSPLTTGVLRDGLVIAVEPILSALPTTVVEEPDGWTLRTHNRCLAVHYEHTIVITGGEPIVLTAA